MIDNKTNRFIRHLDFYTDGAWSSKSEMGGWGLVIVENGEIIETMGGYEPYTTNNRMEQMAILTALRMINEIESSRVEVSIVSDSAYCCNAFNDKWYLKWLDNGWKTADKKDVKNQDLWSEMVALFIKNKDTHNITIKKVEAHKTNEFNNLADAIAVQKRKELEI